MKHILIAFAVLLLCVPVVQAEQLIDDLETTTLVQSGKKGIDLTYGHIGNTWTTGDPGLGKAWQFLDVSGNTVLDHLGGGTTKASFIQSVDLSASADWSLQFDMPVHQPNHISLWLGIDNGGHAAADVLWPLAAARVDNGPTSLDSWVRVFFAHDGASKMNLGAAPAGTQAFPLGLGETSIPADLSGYDLAAIILQGDANPSPHMDNIKLVPGTVPEPGTFVLLGLGLLGLVAMRRRR